MDAFSVVGWRRHHIAEGIVLLPPGETGNAAIQIRERVRPLRTLRSLLDDAVARLAPALRVHATYGAAERFVTASGEYAALGSVVCRHGDRFFQHVSAMVLCDDWFVAIDGIASDAALAPTVEDAVRLLATNYYTELGELRQRPYLYTPPQGWRPVAHPRETRYFGPRHPTIPAVIYMFHARPMRMSVADTQDRLLFLETALIQDKDPPLPAKLFTTRYGLLGEMVKQTGRDTKGRKIESYKTMLADDRFIYLSRLDTQYDEENRALADYVKILEDVISVPLVPQDRHQAVIHWSD